MQFKIIISIFSFLFLSFFANASETYQATTQLNIRSGVGTAYEVVGSISQGDKVLIDTIISGWGVSITLYTGVVKSLGNMGTERLTDYSDPYPPLFEGYKRIEYYQDSRDGTIYVLYVYDNNLNPNVASAQQNCTKAWHSGGNGTDEGCYDSGSDCDLELRNGQVIVICCDEEQEPPIT